MNNRVMIIVLLVTVMVSLITGLALAETSPAVFVNSSPAARQDSLAAEPLFTETGIELPYVWQGSTAWGDYDRDGDLDIVLTSGYLTSAVFRNDGDDQFTDINAGLETVNGCSAAWGDYDNDGDLDLLLVGENANGLHSKIYRNDGSDTFTDIQANITGVWSYPVTAWADYDNDGDLDFLISGLSSIDFGDPITIIYRNDGNDRFVDSEIPAVDGVFMSSVAWGDYDNDDDLDMLWTGLYYETGTYSEIVSKIYRNDGPGNFTDINAALENVTAGSVAWGDYDNDGDLDILLAGYSPTLSEVSRVYRNDGSDVFTDIQAPLVDVAIDPTAAWGDYDNDGDLDILLGGCAGWNDNLGFCTGGSPTKLYHNDGGNSFIDTDEPMPFAVQEPWGDYDNDGDLDILALHANTTIHTTVYKNNITASNTPPSAPDSLRYELVGDSIKFIWDEAEDNETAAAGLSYNLRVGTTPGGTQVLAPMALENGYRQIVQIGNAQLGTTALLRNLSPGTYYWSIQAVDTTFAGSPLAAESSFTLWKVYFPFFPGTQ